MKQFSDIKITEKMLKQINFSKTKKIGIVYSDKPSKKEILTVFGLQLLIFDSAKLSAQLIKEKNLNKHKNIDVFFAVNFSENTLKILEQNTKAKICILLSSLIEKKQLKQMKIETKKRDLKKTKIYPEKNAKIVPKNLYVDIPKAFKFGRGKKILKFENGSGFFTKKTKNIYYINGNIAFEYVKNIYLHNFAEADASNISNIQLLMKFVLHTLGHYKPKEKKPVSLFTIDCECQSFYFNNKKRECTDITGAKNRNDMLFENAIKKTVKRLNKEKVKGLFMVSGDEIKKGKDYAGFEKINIEKNKNSLKFSEKHSLCSHLSNHQKWSYGGYSGEVSKPLTLSKDLISLISKRFFLYLKSVLLFNYPEKVKAFEEKKHKMSQEFIKKTIAEWFNLTKGLKQSAIVRYPSLTRTEKVLQHVEKHFKIDSSDLIDEEKITIPRPYSLLKIENNELKLSKTVEVPCIWIDRFLRSNPDSDYSKKIFKTIKTMFENPESVICFLTHLKLTGGDKTHVHVNILTNSPFISVSEPMNTKAQKMLLQAINKKSKNLNGEELIKHLG